MAHLIDKDALVAEIDDWRHNIMTGIATLHGRQRVDSAFEYEILGIVRDFLDTFEVKEEAECKQPEYSCLETIYQCGKKPHWNIGDTLAYYEFCTDREGVCILGKITKVDFDEEICDWIYTFEKGSVYDEQSLLEGQAYKKN